MPTPTTATPTTATACPDCEAPLERDPRFPIWCPACDWNLTPATMPVANRTPKEQRRAERSERRAAARRATVRARAEKLYESLVDGAPQGRDVAWLAAAAIAGSVHLVTLGLIAGSVALQFTSLWPLRVVGWIGLGLAWFLRPRLGRLTPEDRSLGRSDAPALYALADRVAAAVGGKPVDAIRVTRSFNASFRRVGLRRRRVLTLGLALWVPLSGPQRVALLGHEFGHDVNGDHRRGLWLHAALSALTEWHYFTRTDSRSWNARGAMLIAQMFASTLLRLTNVLVGRMLILLDRLTTRSGQGAEYRADALAARIGSTAAARGMLETLLLEESAETVVARHRSQAGRRRATTPTAAVDLWTQLTEQLTTIPQHERTRRLRLSERDLGSVDHSHPPTHLRIRLLDHQPVHEPTVTLGAGELAAIDAELAPHRALVERALSAG